jgi:hypothetical protein
LLTLAPQPQQLFFIAEYFYSSGTVFIKSSIAVTLLRIADARRRYKWTIWAVIISTIISCIVFISGISNICHPITTLWGETTTGTCNLQLNSDVSFFFSAIEILTDWTLAVLPAALLWGVQMKPKVKFSVALILGMGALYVHAILLLSLSFSPLFPPLSSPPPSPITEVGNPLTPESVRVAQQSYDSAS